MSNYLLNQFNYFFPLKKYYYYYCLGSNNIHNNNGTFFLISFSVFTVFLENKTEVYTYRPCLCSPEQ